MARRARADAGPLGTFGDYPVTRLGIAFRNAGDGLSDSLEIDPVKHETGEETFWVLRCATGPIDHEPLTAEGKKAKGSDLLDGFASYRRVEDQMTLQAMEVTREQVGEWLEENNARIMEAKAEREAEEEQEGEVE